MARKLPKFKLRLDEGFPIRSYLPILNRRFNVKHVTVTPINKNIGVIGVSANLSFEQIDKKLTALLTKSSRKQLPGKITVISGESEN